MGDKGIQKRWKIVLLVILVLAVILVVCKRGSGANRGLDSSGVAYMCTEAGTIEGVSVDSQMNKPITVRTIVYDAASSTDTCILSDGNGADSVLTLTGYQTIPFGEGKIFKKGIRVLRIGSGARLFIYPK